ncbi:activator of basal transcription 1 [Hippocampus comes]|uniref:Activator of basal transcription 1 n=1 Tax=Hippocampus comes TaxID=109280 RepID=A0A3Q2XDN5_HIPCM|nr:PREDICTED: activator of basal transcription 1 [Hippocampus comes]XP_019716308.1 PREDICTED: activator of basal transcription 1 [Hippocampus comes]XP_019716309.1 PREDICTED: activator of basal transcription 1 [Hippocampus comes]
MGRRKKRTKTAQLEMEEGKMMTAQWGKEEEGKTTAKEEEEEDRSIIIQEKEQKEGEKKTTTQEEEEDEVEKTAAKEEEEEEEEDGSIITRGKGQEGEKKTTTQEEEDEMEDGELSTQKEEKRKKLTLKGVAKTSSSLDKKCVPGILYLGHIPPRFRPKHMRNLLSVYGEIGRIFLQPEDGQVKAKKKRSGSRRSDFTEGWVEFRDKRVAKRVAASLHNTPMATRKRQTFVSDLWCIKYLHRFQWTHLSERLAYEQMVLHQRLRTEVSQAKRETNFYMDNVDKSARMDKESKKGKRKKMDAQQHAEERTWDFTQRQTEEEIQAKKKKKTMMTMMDSRSRKPQEKDHLHHLKSQSNVSLLAKIFNSQQT